MDLLQYVQDGMIAFSGLVLYDKIISGVLKPIILPHKNPSFQIDKKGLLDCWIRCRRYPHQPTKTEIPEATSAARKNVR